ncbi:MAG: DMT family transporter, partial [Chlorobiales bacterium]|nr:DMT family transporter [Chlorobiales bacterium]
ALILFGAVQISMVLIGYLRGTKLYFIEWAGIAIAFGGLTYLVLPGITAPTLIGFFLMATAGVAWGIYTLSGKGSLNPLADTAFNFLRTVPFAVVLAVIAFGEIELSPKGILLAAISGGVTSGIGYTIWYTALGGLSATEAAVVQLAVPIIAAIGGVVFVSEDFSLRLAVSATLTLGGILMVTLGQQKFLRLEHEAEK